MHCLMAAGAPAGTSREERAVIAPTDEDLAGGGLLLEMAFQAQVSVPLREHLVMHGAVWIMAGGATFPGRFMLEDKWTALRDMTFGARIGLTGEIESTAFDRMALVRVMAIAAAHLSIFNRMVVWQLKTPLHFKMAAEAHFRRPVRINDGVPRAAGLRVQAAGTVAAFASNVLRVRSVRHEARVTSSRKIFVNLRVALRAVL